MNTLNKVLQVGILFFAIVSQTYSHDMVSVVKKIKPSVVGIGVYTPLGQPRNTLYGSGFVVANGQYAITNHHVIAKELDDASQQELVVFVGTGKQAKARKAKLIGSSQFYDLALLQFEGEPLKPMKLADDEYIDEGSSIAFTGFPIGSILGLYPVTHRGMVASITPVVIPVADSRQMSLTMLRRMRDPYLVYQLDATAYPGNSGSGLYDVKTGAVIGVINKVFVQESKEAVISNPSGITYAIPVRYVRELLNKHKVAF